MADNAAIADEDRTDSAARWTDCTGDVVTGDTIRFTEAVFSGSHHKPTYVGDREVVADVTKDSYGRDKQQHTFTLLVRESTGVQPLSAGTRTTRKGRNIYRNGTQRLLWHDEDDRKEVARGKHHRGDIARAARATRIEERHGC